MVSRLAGGQEWSGFDSRVPDRASRDDWDVRRCVLYERSFIDQSHWYSGGPYPDAG